jgi:hypothetical protein
MGNCQIQIPRYLEWESTGDEYYELRFKLVIDNEAHAKQRPGGS